MNLEFLLDKRSPFPNMYIKDIHRGKATRCWNILQLKVFVFQEALDVSDFIIQGPYLIEQRKLSKSSEVFFADVVRHAQLALNGINNCIQVALNTYYSSAWFLAGK